MNIPNRRVATAISALLFAAPGCMAPLKSRIAPDQEAPFRADAWKFLIDNAHSDEPALRMNALEALQDVGSRQGLRDIEDNLDNGYAGASFAALMAVGTLQDGRAIEKVRLRAEDNDARVRVAALYALHCMGDSRRTTELGDLLLRHPDAYVRANAALAIGRLGNVENIKVLRAALRREKKDAVVMQILEALAVLGDQHGIDRLRMYGYSAVPDQCVEALMSLASCKSPGTEIEELFRFRLRKADQPEIKLQAARGLGRMGYDDGLELACAYLRFNSPDKGRRNDSPEQQIKRIRGLAAMALEAIGSPDSLGPLRNAFYMQGQSDYVRLACARAAIRIIDAHKSKNIASDTQRELRN